MAGPLPLPSTQLPPLNNRKRTHDQISTRQSPCSLRETEGTINNGRSFGLETIRMPAIHRFRGDGFDMRRPVMSTHSTQNQTPNVIDLTEDPPSPIVAPLNNVHPLNRGGSPTRPTARSQRGPRYERDIIATEASEDTPDAAVSVRDHSPEIQFMGVRARPRSHSRSSRSHGHTNHRSHLPADLLHRPSAPHGRPRRLPTPTFGGHAPALISDFEPFMAGFEVFMAERRQAQRGDVVQIDDWPMPLENFEPPDFNFGMQGFNLDHPSRPVAPPRRLPTYDAPPPARAGFTRDLKEDDILVCPNCDDELGVGENDVKRQVWINKSCGHVYCGECAKNRSASSKKVDPISKSKPFKKCVASDCGKTLSKSSMIQVYL